MIKVGDRIPNSILRIKNDTINEVETDQLFINKTSVLFALPGAFTPTCSAKHLPGYINLYDKMKKKGIDDIFCLAVNDPHVMKAWGEQNNILTKIGMLSDSDCSFSRKIGLDHNYGPVLGHRSLRFSILIDNCLIRKLFIEKVGQFEISSAENMIKHL